MSKRRRARKEKQMNPSTGKILTYTLIGLGAYMLYRKFKGLGDNLSDPPANDPFTEEYVQQVAKRKNWRTLVSPDDPRYIAPKDLVSVTREELMAARGGRAPVTGVEGAALSMAVPAGQYQMTPSDVAAVNAAVGPISEESHDALAAQRAREQAYYGNIRRAPTAQDSAKPVVMTDISQVLRTGKQHGTTAFIPHLVSGDDPRASDSVSRRLMAASAARGSGSPVSVDKIIQSGAMKSKSPDPKQLDPEAESKARNVRVVNQVNATFVSSVDKKAISDDFMRAMKSKIGSYTPFQWDAAGAFVGDSNSNEAITFGVLSKYDKMKGTRELQNYQKAVVDQVNAAKRIAGKDMGPEEFKRVKEDVESRARSGARLTSAESQFLNASNKVSGTQEKWQTAYKQVVEVEQLNAKQREEMRNFEITAKWRVTPDGELAYTEKLDVRDPRVASALADLKLKHQLEQQRLKEQQSGVSTTTKAERERWERPTKEAAEASERRSVAVELVKQAIAEKKYQPKSGESFDDAVRKEIATGRIGSDASMRAKAEAKLSALRAEADAEQKKIAATPFPKLLPVIDTSKAEPVEARKEPFAAGQFWGMVKSTAGVKRYVSKKKEPGIYTPSPGDIPYGEMTDKQSGSGQFWGKVKSAANILPSMIAKTPKKEAPAKDIEHGVITEQATRMVTGEAQSPAPPVYAVKRADVVEDPEE